MTISAILSLNRRATNSTALLSRWLLSDNVIVKVSTNRKRMATIKTKRDKMSDKNRHQSNEWTRNITGKCKKIDYAFCVHTIKVLSGGQKVTSSWQTDNRIQIQKVFWWAVPNPTNPSTNALRTDLLPGQSHKPSALLNNLAVETAARAFERERSWRCREAKHDEEGTPHRRWWSAGRWEALSLWAM